MPGLVPDSQAAAATARGAVRGGSTAFMLKRMEQGIGKTNVSTLYLANQIKGNVNLQRVQEAPITTNVKEARDRAFIVQAELNKIIPAIETSAQKPEFKNAFLPQARGLSDSFEMKKALEIDANMTILEKKLAILEIERLKQKETLYKAIQTANNPREKEAQLLQAEKTNQLIEKYKDEMNKYIKQLQPFDKQIGEKYESLANSLRMAAVPTNLRMKDLSGPSAPSIDQQSTAKMPGTRGE